MGFKNEKNELLILVCDLEGIGCADEAQILLGEVKGLISKINKSKNLSEKERKEFQKYLKVKIGEFQRDYSEIYDGLVSCGLS